MAEIKVSQALLPGKFPNIPPPKSHDTVTLRRINNSQRTMHTDVDLTNLTPSVHGRPGTPTSAMQFQQSTGIELPKLILNPTLDSNSRRQYGRLQNMQALTSSFEDELSESEQLPYQGSYFKSSTVMRMYTIPRRHPEMFSSRESLYYNKKKGVILHTDRYQWDDVAKTKEPVDEKSQRDRLEAEIEHVEKIRGIKRRLDSALPHRVQHDLLMGGKKVEFTERVDINGELDRLRAMVLPTDAKDLFIGKGIGSRLPKFHQVNKPRGHPIIDPPVTLSAPAMLDRHGGKMPLHLRQPPPSLPPQQSLDRMFKRECTCVPLPTVPARAKVKNRKRKSVDDSEVKYGETQRKPPVPRFRDLSAPKPVTVEHDTELETSATDLELLGSPTGVNKPNPTLSVSNIKFVSPAQTEGGSNGDVRPSWAKDEDDGPESDVEIELPVDADGQVVSPERQENLVVSPRAGTSASPLKVVTPNPLKFVDPGIGDEEKDFLRATFKRLDTDADGHILYQQIKTQLPEDISSAQEKYIRQVYEITSASTFFGVEEFFTMTAFINKFKELRGPALEALEKIDMIKIRERIIKYVELFQTVDRSGKGGISVESAEEVISQAMEKSQETDQELLTQIFNVLKPDDDDTISKLEFILHIPYFTSLEKPSTGSSKKSE